MLSVAVEIRESHFDDQADLRVARARPIQFPALRPRWARFDKSAVFQRAQRPCPAVKSRVRLSRDVKR